MPKATVAGASVADEDGVCRTFEPLPVVYGGDQPPVATGDYEEGGEEASVGNSSLESTGTPGKSSTSSDELLPPPAPTTESPSLPGSTDDPAAGTTSTSTTASDTTSPDDGSATATKGRKR